MATVLLTGATGYLGRHLNDRLIATGYNVVPFRHFQDPDAVISENRPEVIIHCATCYGRGGETMEQLREANVSLPTRIIETAIKAHVKAFINTDTVLPPATSDYSETKFEFKRILRAANDLPIRIDLQFEQFFGPGDHDSKLFPTFLIRKLLSNAPSIPLTPGLQKRHFLYIDDAVDAYQVVLSKYPQIGLGFHEFQVSTEESVSIHDFACLAKEVAGNTVTQLDFGAIPYRENELMESITDISKIKDLGWRQKTSLLAALTETIKEEYKR